MTGEVQWTAWSLTVIDAAPSAQMRVQVFISFGGLLLQLTGDLQKLQELDVDANIYLLMRKV